MTSSYTAEICKPCKSLEEVLKGKTSNTIKLQSFNKSETP